MASVLTGCCITYFGNHWPSHYDFSNAFSTAAAVSETKLENLELEKCRLENELAAVRNKLEIQQQHSGGLGVALLQERLEAQQRRIAVLELSRKVSHKLNMQISLIRSAWE